MSRSIRLLPEQVINQIAAGEVVERPASVVKELLENSMDAGATRITVDIEASGVSLVRVTDDGRGIAPDELALAAQRHCTSKLREVDDLLCLESFGFRGEALASIASVSRMTLSSRTREADATGWCLECAPVSAQPRPTAHPPGTTVEVRDLFGNAPARRKHLKGERTEWRHIQQAVRAAALARPDVALRLRRDNRECWSVRAEEQVSRQRIEAVFGNALARAAHPVAYTAAGIAVHGWVVSSEALGRSSLHQYLVMNGRPVRDLSTWHAVRVAYADALHDDLEPSFVLAVDLSGEDLDINVHPAKAQVRIAEPRTVHDVVLAAVRQALGGNTGDGHPEPDRDPASRNGLEPNAPGPVRGGIPARRLPMPGARPVVREKLAVYRNGPRASVATGADDLVIGNTLGLVAGRYIVEVRADEVVVVDELVAMRLTLAARWSEAWHQQHGDDTAIPSRSLLVPEPLDDIPAIAAMRPHLHAVGVTVEPAGAERWWLRAQPRLLGDMSILESLRAMVTKAGESVTGIELIQHLATGLDRGERLPAGGSSLRARLRELHAAAADGYLELDACRRVLAMADFASLFGAGE